MSFWRTWPSLLTLSVLLAVHSAVAGETGGVRIAHPDTVLAGSWPIPLFIQVDGDQEDSVRVSAWRGNEDPSPFGVKALPGLSGERRYVAYLDDPLLAAVPGGSIAFSIFLGDSVALTGTIPVAADIATPSVVSVSEEGAVLLLEGDGCGNLAVTDTLPVEGGIEEALVMRNGIGGIDIATFSGDGEVTAWRRGHRLEKLFRQTLGGHASCCAPLPEGDSFIAGFLDGRIVRIGWDEGTVTTLTTAGGIPASLAAGDVDGDDIPDLAGTVLEMNRSLLLFWKGDGKGGFESAPSRAVPLPGSGRDVAFARIGDGGKKELAVLLDGGKAALSGIMLGLLDDRAGARSISIPGVESRQLFRMLNRDFNGNGLDDIALLHGAGETAIELFLSEEGNAGEAWPSDIVPVGGPEVGVVAVDLDRNGATDLVVGEGEFRIYLNDGTGKLFAQPFPPAGHPARLFGPGG